MNIQQEITRYTNLEANDSLSAFRGHTAQQYHGAFEVFYNFIQDVKPKRILEIGTSLGGFTTFLKLVCDDLNLDTNIRSYDISKHSWYDDIVALGIDLRVENIFTDQFLDFNAEVKDYINQDGVTIVLCDGGWKIGEFNVISPYIKPNDFILAHDYAETKEIFQTKILNKIWNWHEIERSDIQNSIDANNLIDYLPETFHNIAWGCFIKQDT